MDCKSKEDIENEIKKDLANEIYYIEIYGDIIKCDAKAFRLLWFIQRELKVLFETSDILLATSKGEDEVCLCGGFDIGNIGDMYIKVEKIVQRDFTNKIFKKESALELIGFKTYEMTSYEKDTFKKVDLRNDNTCDWYEKLKLKYNMLNLDVNMLRFKDEVYSDRILGTDKQVGLYMDSLKGSMNFGNIKYIIGNKLLKDKLELGDINMLHISNMRDSSLRVKSCSRVNIKKSENSKVYVESCEYLDMTDYFNNVKIELGSGVKFAMIGGRNYIGATGLVVDAKCPLSNICILLDGAFTVIIYDESIQSEKDIQWIEDMKYDKYCKLQYRLSDEASIRIGRELGWI